MSSNNAFTKKLRSAIKTKIQEYGVDADDELPDYVMILSANRKEKHQMKTDLQLFLGKHTTQFVDWLFDAFGKLKKDEQNDTKESTKKSTSSSNKVESQPKVEDVERESNSKKSADKISRKSDEKLEIKKRNKRSPSIQSLSPPTRLRSEVVVVKRSPSPKRKESRRNGRSSRYDDRNRSKTTRNDDRYEKKRSSEKASSDSKRKRNSNEEKPVSISDSDDEKKSKLNETRKQMTPPKIHYDDLSKPSSSNIIIEEANEEDQNEGEILMVGQKEEEKVVITRRFTIKVGDKHFRRNSDQELKFDEVESSRKRRSDDPGRTVTKLLNSQDLKIASRLERFEKENTKRPKLQTPESKDNEDVVEPYSPAPIKSNDDENEEKQIDSFLHSFQTSQVVVQQPLQQQFIIPQYPSDQTYSFKMPAPERCKFWPDCNKSSEDCSYHHPTQLCQHFPNCTYRSKCLNVHPMCKFGSKCAKLNCPFTHTGIYSQDTASSVKLPTSSSFRPKSSYQSYSSSMSDSGDTVVTKSIPCKFKNRCTNEKCEFIHPDLCRYGNNCKNITKCPFRHLVNLKKFQWKKE